MIVKIDLTILPPNIKDIIIREIEKKFQFEIVIMKIMIQIKLYNQQLIIATLLR